MVSFNLDINCGCVQVLSTEKPFIGFPPKSNKGLLCASLMHLEIRKSDLADINEHQHYLKRNPFKSSHIHPFSINH